MTKQRVLVPNDGSAFCRQIYPHIVKFCEPGDTVLVLLRVGNAPEGHVPMPPRPVSLDVSVSAYESQGEVLQAYHPIFASQERESAEADIRRELIDDVQMLEQLGYEVEVVIRFGDRGEEIVKYSEYENIDLIAMTTHWRRGIQKLIFGSVAQHVASHVNIPILMVRPQVDES